MTRYRLVAAVAVACAATTNVSAVGNNTSGTIRENIRESHHRGHFRSGAKAQHSKEKKRTSRASGPGTGERIHSRLRPDTSKMKRMTKEEMDLASSRASDNLNDPNHQWFRRSGYTTDEEGSFYSSNLADLGAEYDYWQQAYRMLGAFIDCDHPWSYDRHRKLGGSQDGDVNYNACSRWMMWAAYVDPNYQGGGYYEYHPYSDDQETVGTLDCHQPDTEWQLLGVYRQEFYQFIEQISKHLWAINEKEYIVALAGLAYMTKYECTYLGSDENGNSIYSAIQPLEGGDYQISLYLDDACLQLNTGTTMTYDDFGLTSDMSLGSKDDEDYDDDTFYESATTYWQATQEYTLSNLNAVYDQYKYCTLCIDYPTYQDGFLIGDTGMEDDDLINQCWKFHSHDSFVCEADCIALGDAQGTIVQVQYGGKTFGSSWEGAKGGMFSGNDTTNEYGPWWWPFSQSRTEQLLANLFLTLSGILFVITFVAFAVARGSRPPVDNSGKSRALLEDEEKARAASSQASSRRRSKSRKRDGDSRSKARSERRSKSRSRRDDQRRSKSSSRRESERERSSRSDRSPRSEKDRSERDRSDRGERSERGDRSERRSGSRSRRSDRDRERDRDRRDRNRDRDRRDRDEGDRSRKSSSRRHHLDDF